MVEEEHQIFDAGVVDWPLECPVCSEDTTDKLLIGFDRTNNSHDDDEVITCVSCYTVYDVRDILNEALFG